MADPKPPRTDNDAAQAPPIEPVVIPDVATQPHALPNVVDPPTVATDPDDELPSEPMSPESPLGNYAREIQLEYEEQQEEGKI